MRREVEQKAENERLAVANAERQARLLPEREKLKNYELKIKALLADAPDISDIKLSGILHDVERHLAQAINCIGTKVFIIDKPVDKPVDNDDDWS